ncbi:MAG TPA: dynamin family protein [Kineosporiaceae bacterium]|nr:dynamin family protein [Kineosporiaceae bacterium]
MTGLMGDPQTLDPLTESVRALTRMALDRAQDTAAREQLTLALERLSQPLRLAIAGRVKAGKSTLLNALIGEELAPTDAGECTRLVTWYLGGDNAQVLVHYLDGRREPRPYRRDGGALDIDLGAPVEEIDHLEVTWPSSRLRDITLIDTPGIASLSAEISERVSVLLPTDDERAPTADAVLYLLRHAHASDIRFLEAFHDDDLGRGTPVNAVGVLSRADEIGCCRLDALDIAARVAGRYQHDQRIRRLCPLVIPVSGLLGQAGTTLREDEYRALARIAALSDEVMEDLLLTADRLIGEHSRTDLTQLERRHLIDRLGLFGVRFAVMLIRTGKVRSATELAVRLTDNSGLGDLRDVLLHQFTQRSRLLRARSALSAVRAVVRRGGCAEPDLLEVTAEEISSSAHEFREIRLLNDLRSGSLAIQESRWDEMERLLGGSGHSPAARLGLPEEASSADLSAAALHALESWQALAGSPFSGRQVQLAARDVIRTIEGIFADLPQP